jgi:hypothetical protein
MWLLVEEADNVQYTVDGRGASTMTDERRNYVRRQEDHVSHAALADAVKSVREEIIGHVHPEIGRIIDTLEGKEVTRLDGTVDRPDGGLVAEVKDIKATLANGVKVRQSITWRDKAQIIAAFVTAVGVVLAAGAA